MFYNSKKLIDEKVLQQYFFELFMLADAKRRKDLLPEKYWNGYSSTGNIKGLQPEVTLSTIKDKNGKDKKHIVDFVLYPIKDKGLKKLNIEIKWLKEDFEEWRYPYYDGSLEEGFVVCMNAENSSEIDFIIDKVTGKKTNIPVVYLEPEDFKKWFTKNSYNIISQALSNKLKIKPNRLTGRKYWLIAMRSDAMKHYTNFGRKNYIWAFRDNKNPENIMKILEDDYIVFVNISNDKPFRMIYPKYKDELRKIEKSRGGFVNSKDISWDINLIDIFKVKDGYKIDYSRDKLYTGFDEEWVEEGMKDVADKTYTQFVRFKTYDRSDQYQYYWDKDENFKIDRDKFDGEDEVTESLVSIMRKSLNSSGDAVEMTHDAFQKIVQIVSEV